MDLRERKPDSVLFYQEEDDDPPTHWGTMVHTHNPSTWEVEARRASVQNHS